MMFSTRGWVLITITALSLSFWCVVTILSVG